MKSTAIECKLIREGGTRAEIGGIEYHFAPRADGAHVADIEDQDHVDVFLSAPEGYRLYRGTYDSDGHQWYEAGPSAKDTPIESPTVAEHEVDERAALVAEYEAKFDKKPSGRLSVAKIREALAAA